MSREKEIEVVKWMSEQEVEEFEITQQKVILVMINRAMRRLEQSEAYKRNWVGDSALDDVDHDIKKIKQRKAALQLVAEYRSAVLNLNGLTEPTVSHGDKDKFYKSGQWQRLRYKVLSKSSMSCALCGARRSDGAELHVDHIEPRSLRPDLELDADNLQVLCKDCNLGKSNLDNTDFRAIGSDITRAAANASSEDDATKEAS